MPTDSASPTALADRLQCRRASLVEILPLRHAVLRPGRPAAEAAFEGDDEPATRHFAAVAETGEVRACLSLVARPWRGETAYQLRGMAVHPEDARRGLGTALLRHAERALVSETGVRLLWCNARVEAVPFYARRGWAVVSEEFEIAGVGPHRVMVRRPA